MTRLVFETAALADAIKKAEKIAPSTAGQAFDKAAGILMEVNPGTPAPVIIRATNLDLYSMEWLDVIESEGAPVRWRMPSRLLSQVVSSLPIGSGRNVTMEDQTNGRQVQVHITSGTTKARFNLMDADYYPSWPAFDPDKLTPVADLGGRMAQVEWATAKTEPPICGVNFDGEYVQATDKYRLVRAPLQIAGMSDPVTIPAKILAPLLKQTGEIMIAFSGEQLYLMPDEHSQYRAVIYGQPFPNLSRPMSRVLPNSFKVKKTQILEILQRASSFADSNRDPVLRCFIGKQEFAVMMENEETGLLGDRINLAGQVDHPRVEVKFTPKNIIEPITQAPSDEIEFYYNAEDGVSPIKIDGGSGFEAWTMPRRSIE